jgi:hypothetical protein
MAAKIKAEKEARGTDLAAKSEKSIAPVVQAARDLDIKGAEDMKQAAEMLSRVNKTLDAATEEKERVTKPLNEALKAERSRWKPLETICIEAKDILSKKMSVYQTEQKRLAQEEEDKIAARVGEGKGKLRPETAVRQMEEIEKPAESVAAGTGLVDFISVPQCEVEDFMALIKATGFDFVNIEMKKQALLNAQKEGKEFPGVRYWSEERPRNYR